jgi:hypothetical protein
MSNIAVKDAAGATQQLSATTQADSSNAYNVCLSSPGGAALAASNGGIPVDAAGAKVTAATIPTGGTGLLGWLSAIWYQLTQSLTVSLPANASQETGGNLASIATNTGHIPAQGQALAAASVPVVLPALQVTALTPPAAITNYANETGGNLASIATNTGHIPAQGQALAAASVPVVLPALQVTALTPPAAITNYANETGGNLATIATNTGHIPAQGQALAAGSLPVVLTVSQLTTLTPPVTQAISAAALPLPTGAATAANQASANTTLSTIAGYLAAQIELSSTLWTDSTGAYFVRRDVVTESTGAISVVFVNAAGTTVTPGSGLVPVNATQNQIVDLAYVATSGGTGYSTSDILLHCTVISEGASPAVLASLWLNLTTGAIITAPTGGSYGAIAPLAANASQETGGNLATIATNTGRIPAQGQALAAGSWPVVLTAAQVTTLTPPAAITNYANETGGNLATVATNTAQGTKTTASTMPAGGVGLFGWLSSILYQLTQSLIVNITQIGGTTFALGQSLAAASIPVTLPQDGIVGSMQSLLLTLSGSATTVSKVAIPNTAQGVRLFPRTYPVQFGFGADTIVQQATATFSGTTIATGSLGVGGIAKNDQWEVRLIAPGTSRTLNLIPSGSNISGLVDVEFF